jgi:hypothetical protein
MRGILSPSGTMLFAGLGNSDDGATWTYEFQEERDWNRYLKGSF